MHCVAIKRIELFIDTFIHELLIAYGIIHVFYVCDKKNLIIL